MSIFLRSRTQVLILFLLLVLAGSCLQAQPLKKFSSKSFGINEGLLSGQVTDIAEDGNGFLWITAGPYLQRFDGRTFTAINVRPGLPQTTHVNFFTLADGNIWLYTEEGISFYDRTTDKFSFIYSTAVKDNTAGNSNSDIPLIKPFIQTGNVVWCWNEREKLFIALDERTGKQVDKLAVADDQQPWQGREDRYKKGAAGNVFFDSKTGALVQIDFNAKQVKHVFRLPPAYAQIIAYGVVSDTNILIATPKGIYNLNCSTSQYSFLTAYPQSFNEQVYTAAITRLQGQLFALVLNGNVFILDAQAGKVLYRMADQQNHGFVNPGYINNCMTDNTSHLWLITAAEGLKKISYNNFDIKYYGAGEVEKNFNRCIYADKQANLIIAGSLFDGLYVFDTAQNLIRHFALHLQEQTACILKLAAGKYLLFTGNNPGTYLFNTSTMQLTPYKGNGLKDLVAYPLNYFSHLQYLTDSTTALFCNYCVLILHHNGNSLYTTVLPVHEYFTSGIIDNKNKLWLAQSGILHLYKGNNFEQQVTITLPEKVATKCFFEDREHNIWLGTEKGLFQLNSETGAVMNRYQKIHGLANDCIYSITDDNKGNIWCSTNKGISAIYKSGKIVNLYSSDGLQGEEFNTNSCAKAADGELFFGGVNGVNSFYPEKINSPGRSIKILLTNINVMDEPVQTDTAIWNLSSITLPSTNNVISFNFSALGWYSPEVYHYQYKMNGIDKGWVDAGNLGYARYVLPPGSYLFEYTAANDLRYKRSVLVIITPPFWQTTWFIAIAILCGILLIVVLVNLYNKRKHHQRQRLIALQHTVQEERERISRDLHDNIGAYTTVLIANAEQINRDTAGKDVQQSVDNIAENAKHIMRSLQETIWVLSSDVITITDFIDRFKVYAKKIANNFAGVQVKFKEDLEKDAKLSPAEGLHLFRILQEALQNAFKHAAAQHIIIGVNSSDTIYLSIQDDGKGFNINSIVPGNGLQNMQHRAKEAGYEWHIISNEQGTLITLKKNQSFAV